MSQMYQEECGDTHRASFLTYYKVLKQMRLKFHVPKKDICGLCEEYRRSEKEGRSISEELRSRYERHLVEKNKVRLIKSNLKTKSQNDVCSVLACFDLEQVLYCPNQTDLKYSRNGS